MTWSFVTFLLALLPVAGTLIVMDWTLRESKNQSSLFMLLSRDRDAEQAPGALESSYGGSERPATDETPDHAGRITRSHELSQPCDRKCHEGHTLHSRVLVAAVSIAAESSHACAHEISWRAGD